MSNHSKIAIDAYLEKHKPDVVFFNETKQQIPDNAFTNYTTLSSTPKKSTGGVALSFRNDVAYAQIEELETKNNDYIVAAANVRGLKLLTTTAYVKPDNKGELLELIKRLEACKVYADTNHMEGVLLFGDCNARHLYWDDQKCNALGNELISLVPTYTILNDGQPTFLSINGQSVIDLCICYGNFINQYKCSLTTDEDTELFTGAPSRGHLPVLVSLVESKSGYFKEKPWIEKAMWDDWRAHLETEMLDWTNSDNVLEMW